MGLSRTRAEGYWGAGGRASYVSRDAFQVDPKPGHMAEAAGGLSFTSLRGPSSLQALDGGLPVLGGHLRLRALGELSPPAPTPPPP